MSGSLAPLGIYRDGMYTLPRTPPTRRLACRSGAPPVTRHRRLSHRRTTVPGDAIKYNPRRELGDGPPPGHDISSRLLQRKKELGAERADPSA
jgi:hypothetical protein